MRAEIFGAISGALVFISAIPYFRSVVRGENEQHPVSWILWTIIGFTLLVTYQASGASFWSLLPVLQAFVNPALVLCVILYKKWRNREKVALRLNLKTLKWHETACLMLGLVSLGAWALVRDNKELAQWPFYLSLVADVFAAVPTIVMLLRNPEEDKPGPWVIFVLGYVFALPAVAEPSFTNYALPIYMIVVYGVIALITTVYRIKARVPLREWRKWV